MTVISMNCVYWLTDPGTNTVKHRVISGLKTGCDTNRGRWDRKESQTLEQQRYRKKTTHLLTLPQNQKKKEEMMIVSPLQIPRALLRAHHLQLEETERPSGQNSQRKGKEKLLKSQNMRCQTQPLEERSSLVKQ